MNQARFLYGSQYSLALCVAVVLFFSPLMFSETHFKAGVVVSDFPASIEFAQHLQQGIGDVPGFVIAHSAWALLLIAANSLLGISFRMGAFLVAISSILAAALVLYYFWFVPVLRSKGISLWWAVLAAFGLNVITPLSLLVFVDRKWYLGYIGITSYHNPTIILLQPFALLQFVLAFRCFQSVASTSTEITVATATTLLATFAKPSFAICFLPALCLVMAYRFWRKQPLNWRFSLLGFVIPTTILLAFQFLLAYGSSGQAAIFFYPLGVMEQLSDFIGIKFMLSIVFPLLVAALFFRDATHDLRMILAWSTFLLGAFYAYFVAESAPRTFDGNFIWGAQTALLMLFSVSTLFLFERIREIRWKAALPGFIWFWHLAYGVSYYHHIFITQKYS